MKYYFDGGKWVVNIVLHLNIILVKLVKILDGSAGISEVSEEKSSAADDQSALNMIMKISTSTRDQKSFKLISWS